MTAQRVEWVLVIFYGRSAHRATYGRLKNTKYTKDYIQLSRTPAFLDAVSKIFRVDVDNTESIPLTFQWHSGTTPGDLVIKSADRPHLKWETGLGAPCVWKMTLDPDESTAETIPGDPSHLDFDSAENELALLSDRGAGQPYLLAVKLRNEARTVHLRAYLGNPDEDYAWASLTLLPEQVQAIAAKTSQNSALAWSIFQDDEVCPFFDPTRNHDAWRIPSDLYQEAVPPPNPLMETTEEYLVTDQHGDAIAEKLETDPIEVDLFRKRIKEQGYEVADSTATVKTRGSAQRAFAETVKGNYGYQCAITGIVTKDFLIAAHIVPWSQDQSIRLDPSNGICLSLLVDRAFENGHLLIDDDFTIRIDLNRIGNDSELRAQLAPFNGRKLKLPIRDAPQSKYLARRRELVNPTN